MTPPAATLDSGAMVLDVPLSCAWCFADEASEAAWALLSRLQSAPAPVPSLWLWETANVLLQAERRGRITAAALRTFLGLLESLPIRVDHGSTASVWHDTLELALRLGLPLASRDQALQTAARLEGIPLLPT